MSKKTKKKNSPSAAKVLRLVKADVRGMEWNKLDDDGRSILIRKADVLAIINDHIDWLRTEFLRASRQNTHTVQRMRMEKSSEKVA